MNMNHIRLVKKRLSQIVPEDRIEIIENYSVLHEDALEERMQRKCNNTVLRKTISHCIQHRHWHSLVIRWQKEYVCFPKQFILRLLMDQLKREKMAEDSISIVKAKYSLEAHISCMESCTILGIPPTFVLTTGRPYPIASNTDIGIPSL